MILIILFYFIFWNFKGSLFLDVCCSVTSTTHKVSSCDWCHEELFGLPLDAINIGPDGYSDTNLMYTKWENF